VRLRKPARDLLTGAEHGGELTLEPLGVAVLQETG
jgi:Beta-galactosidase C-terminal domain